MARAETRTRCGTYLSVGALVSSTSIVRRMRPLAWCSMTATRPVSLVEMSPPITLVPARIVSNLAKRTPSAKQSSVANARWRMSRERVTKVSTATAATDAATVRK